MYRLILPLGIINFILILLQILGGLKVIRINYKWHRNLGILLGILALIHGAIAIVYT
jgi:hypothetical protein